MKKVLFVLFNLLTLTTMAETKGRFEIYDFDNFKLHVYYTNDALGDASYVIEGKNELVTMEQPLFKDNVAEFDQYVDKLGIPYVWFPATAAEGAEGAEPAGDEVKNIVTGEQVAADCTSWEPDTVVAQQTVEI